MKTSDKILTFVAVFISCLALTVSIVQTRIMQKQSHASVWPRLSNGQGFGPDYFNYTVNNDGVGPAIIKDIYFTYKDTSFYLFHDLMRYFGELETQELGSRPKLSFSYSNIFIGGVIKPGEQVEVYDSLDSLSTVLGKKYLLKTDIKVDYCSIYDQCWTMENDDVREL